MRSKKALTQISIESIVLTALITLSSFLAAGAVEPLRFLKPGSQNVEDFQNVGTEVVCEVENTRKSYLLVRFGRTKSLTPIPEVL